MDRLLQTSSSLWTLTALRVTLGGVMLMHGVQKLGWFGGPGYTNVMRFFTETLHLPTIVGLFVIVTETLGAAMLIVGALTRGAALATIAVMIGAIVTVHLPVGFFMNWFGALPGEGYEYHLLVIAIAGVLVREGAGAYSVDALLAAVRTVRPAEAT